MLRLERLGCLDFRQRWSKLKGERVVTCVHCVRPRHATAPQLDSPRKMPSLKSTHKQDNTHDAEDSDRLETVPTRAGDGEESDILVDPSEAEDQEEMENRPRLSLKRTYETKRLERRVAGESSSPLGELVVTHRFYGSASPATVD